MATRAPIQIPTELKDKMDGLKHEFGRKTHYEVIEYLIDYYNRMELQREQDQEDRQAERFKLQQEYIHCGVACKNDLTKFVDQYRLSDHTAAIALLHTHFVESPTIPKIVFDYYNKIRD